MREKLNKVIQTLLDQNGNSSSAEYCSKLQAITETKAGEITVGDVCLVLSVYASMAGRFNRSRFAEIDDDVSALEKHIKNIVAI